LLVVMVYFKHY